MPGAAKSPLGRATAMIAVVRQISCCHAYMQGRNTHLVFVKVAIGSNSGQDVGGLMEIVQRQRAEEAQVVWVINMRLDPAFCQRCCFVLCTTGAGAVPDTLPLQLSHQTNPCVAEAKNKQAAGICLGCAGDAVTPVRLWRSAVRSLGELRCHPVFDLPCCVLCFEP